MPQIPPWAKSSLLEFDKKEARKEDAEKGHEAMTETLQNENTIADSIQVGSKATSLRTISTRGDEKTREDTGAVETVDDEDEDDAAVNEDLETKQILAGVDTIHQSGPVFRGELFPKHTQPARKKQTLKALMKGVNFKPGPDADVAGNGMAYTDASIVEDNKMQIDSRMGEDKTEDQTTSHSNPMRKPSPTSTQSTQRFHTPKVNESRPACL
jgi:hypothetical protein